MLKNATIIRKAKAEDSPEIALLCTQLGYPATPEEIRARLQRIQEDQNHHVIYVAEQSDETLVGWVEIVILNLILCEQLAEITGLVVEQEHRGKGTGHLLMKEAESWVRGKGCSIIQLKSNVVREKAHTFYEQLGYVQKKTQKVFIKLL